MIMKGSAVRRTDSPSLSRLVSRDALLGQRGEMVKNVMAKGGRVLVIGVRPDNVGQDLWNNPRLVFYESRDDRTVDTRDIPANVKLILFARFVSHPTTKHFVKIANKRNIHCIPAFNGTGELRKILQEAKVITAEDPATQPSVEPPIDYDKVEPHTPFVPLPVDKIRGLHGGIYTKVETPVGGATPRGTTQVFMAEFLAIHYPSGLPDTLSPARWETVMAEAKHVGLDRTTLGSLRQVLWMMRKNAAPPKPIAPSAPPPSTPPPSVARIDPSNPLVLESLALLDSIMTSCQLAKEKLLEDYAQIESLVSAGVRAKLQAFLERGV